MWKVLEYAKIGMLFRENKMKKQNPGGKDELGTELSTLEQ
jgi:hypothetical protein